MRHVLPRLLCFQALLCALLLGAAPARTPAAEPDLFPAYATDFAHGQAEPATELSGIARPAKDCAITKAPDGVSVQVRDTGVWRGYWPVGSLGQWAGYAPLFGGERLHVAYAYAPAPPGTAAPGTELSIQYYGGQTVTIAAAAALIADGQPHELTFTLPDDARGKAITALWLRLDNPGPGAASFQVRRFSWDRRILNTRLDADRILKTPPPHETRVAPVHGAMAIVTDGVPMTGLGWTSILPQNVSDPEFTDMETRTGFPLARLTFTLGEHIPLEYYPPSWLGPDQFDFSFLDRQMDRLRRANPRAKVMLQVALDGARWWVWRHPEAGGMDARDGIPDYLSPAWVRDSRDAIRQMIAHVQTRPYAGAIVGYELMNGPTEDCTFEINVTTPAALSRFREILRAKYKTDAGLQSAWDDPSITLATATPQILPADRDRAFFSPGAFPLLYEPARCPALEDKIAYASFVHEQVILNFARAVKEATQGRATVGARTGNLMGNLWDWPAPLQAMQDPMARLAHSPDFDFFEVQEPYVGRGLADYASGVPVTAPQGLAGLNKLVLIQNDVRTHLSAPTEGYGRTPDLASTLTVQRRVFVNALVHGMSPYLWQQSYGYDDPQMLADFRRQQDVAQKALAADRRSGAQAAFVFDADYRKFFGVDPRTSPKVLSPAFALFDYPKFTWARAGVPFDMIFLDQLASARPYKVYVFVHTVGLTAAQRALITRVAHRPGRVAVFVWADGLLDGKRVNPAQMSALVGMTLSVSSEPRTWEMKPTPWFQSKAGADAGAPLGVLPSGEYAEPGTAQYAFAPSFVVTDPRARAIATYDGSRDVGVAVRQTPQGTSLYSASPNLSPALLRYALRLAGVFSYTDADDACYINQSFLGVHARQTHTLHLRLPHASALTDVFDNQDKPAGTAFTLPVVRGQTYLFYRGSRAAWEALGRK